MKELFAPPQKVPVRVFADTLDRESERRLRGLALLDHVRHPIAVMPDVHPAGEGTVVGTVLVSREAIYPSLIGDDIGCGMSSMRLPLLASSFERRDWERLLPLLAEKVPAGRATQPRTRTLPASLLTRPLSTRALDHERERVGAWHFGTLGEGNHFLEIQRDPEDRLWVTVHTGSRGMGAAISRHHVRACGSRDHGLAVLVAGSEPAEGFLRDHDWALRYAAESRRAVLDAVLETLFPGGEPEERFDVTHNSVAVEAHDGEHVFVHRKGAMAAPAGSTGIIPGSMGTASYIVEGLGAAESYGSCSHGAGRLLSRTEARRRIAPSELRRRMKDVLYLSGTEDALVEEAPQAYKDVREVLDMQRDLVRPLMRLTPLAVLKG